MGRMNLPIQSLFLVTALTAGCGAPPTDSEIADAVGQQLRSDEALRNYSLSVSSMDGEITLVGVVGSERERTRAEELAGGVDGVSNVNNEISITPSDAPAVGAPPPAGQAPAADRAGSAEPSAAPAEPAPREG